MSLAAFTSRLHDPAFYYEGPSQCEAAARLDFAWRHGMSAVALLGPSGTGKTLLLERRRREIARAAATVVALQPPGEDVGDLYMQLTEQLGLQATPNSGRHFWRDVTHRLAELRYDRTPLLVTIDNADRLSAASYEIIARLGDADPSPELRRSLVFVAEHVERLPALLRDRIDLRIDLPLWTINEIRGFLLDAAQDEKLVDRLFDVAALERLGELSNGVPRRVRRLTRLALAALQGDAEATIDSETVSRVQDELCLPV